MNCVEQHDGARCTETTKANWFLHRFYSIAAPASNKTVNRSELSSYFPLFIIVIIIWNLFYGISITQININAHICQYKIVVECVTSELWCTFYSLVSVVENLKNGTLERPETLAPWTFSKFGSMFDPIRYHRDSEIELSDTPFNTLDLTLLGSKESHVFFEIIFFRQDASNITSMAFLALKESFFLRRRFFKLEINSAQVMISHDLNCVKSKLGWGLKATLANAKFFVCGFGLPGAPHSLTSALIRNWSD